MKWSNKDTDLEAYLQSEVKPLPKKQVQRTLERNKVVPFQEKETEKREGGPFGGVSASTKKGLGAWWGGFLDVLLLVFLHEITSQQESQGPCSLGARAQKYTDNMK